MAVQCRTSALHCHQLLYFLVVPSTVPLTHHRPLRCHFHCCHIASLSPVSFDLSPYDAAASVMPTVHILIKIPRPQVLISLDPSDSTPFHHLSHSILRYARSGRIHCAHRPTPSPNPRSLPRYAAQSLAPFMSECRIMSMGDVPNSSFLKWKIIFSWKF